MKYRREIDGLRAVAVLPVILFHAGFSVFSGGYVGVDVFFVISGYLITTILIDEMTAGRFSLARFYERRARRILPALFAVILCCLPFAAAWMLPEQQLAFARSLVAVSLFASNVLFWRESGYFDPAAEEKPLLHTWSLAVEEQYYILFPLLLMALWRIGRARLAVVVVALAALSLGLAEWGWRNHPTAAFYLAPTRAWELLAGSLCAFALAGRPAPAGREWPAALGLAMILGAILAFDNTVPFPSLWTLVPVGGTVLVILFARPGTLTARALSVAPLVGIGLISYSAYLWHQPLFAFARIRSLHAPEPWLMGALAVASLVLAWITWRYVEQPFRRGPVPVLAGRRALLGASAAGLAGVALLGVGLQQAGPLQARAAAATEAAVARDTAACAFSGFVPLDRVGACLAAAPAPVILLGDSHAGAVSAALRAQLAAAGGTLVSLTHGGCLPIPQTGRLPRQAAEIESCTRFTDRAARLLAAHPGVPLVVAARWPLHLQGTRFDNGEGGHEGGPAAPTHVIDPATGRIVPGADLAGHVVATLSGWATERPLVVLTAFPEAGWNVSDLVRKAALHGRPVAALSTDAALYAARNGGFNARLAGIGHGAEIVDVGALFCDTVVPGRCVNLADGTSYYRDDDHPSRAAADMIAVQAVQALVRGDAVLAVR